MSAPVGMPDGKCSARGMRGGQRSSCVCVGGYVVEKCSPRLCKITAQAVSWFPVRLLKIASVYKLLELIGSRTQF